MAKLERQRVVVRLRPDLAERLRIYSAKATTRAKGRVSMSQVVAEALERFLKK